MEHVFGSKTEVQLHKTTEYLDSFDVVFVIRDNLSFFAHPEPNKVLGLHVVRQNSLKQGQTWVIHYMYYFFYINITYNTYNNKINNQIKYIVNRNIHIGNIVKEYI